MVKSIFIGYVASFISVLASGAFLSNGKIVDKQSKSRIEALFLIFLFCISSEFIRSKSGAAAGLCAWVINIIKFYEVFCDVEPKRKALAAANAELAAATEKLKSIKAKVNVSKAEQSL